MAPGGQIQGQRSWPALLAPSQPASPQSQGPENQKQNSCRLGRNTRPGEHPGSLVGGREHTCRKTNVTPGGPKLASGLAKPSPLSRRSACPGPQLTEWHDGEVFPPELAGDGDLLPEAPAIFGEHVVRSCRRVVAHLRPNPQDMSIYWTRVQSCPPTIRGNSLPYAQ